ncbi:flippase-like domain-containing protein, partial [bacterium]|nr:flippase-like domain-containing protein [bacterium]
EMTRKSKKIITQLAGILISVVFLVYLFYKVDFKELADALKGANYLWLIPNVILIMVTMVFRAYRWKHMIEPIKQIAVSRLFSITMIGFMANNVLPARLGEVVRAYFLSKKTGIRKSLSLATIVLERLSDFAALLLSALLVSLFFSLPPVVERMGIVAGLIFVFFVLLLIFFHFRKDETLRFFERVLFILSPTKKQRMMERVNAFVEGLLILKSGKGFLWIFSLSVAVWALWVVALHYTLLAFDIQVPFSARLLILAVVNLGALIPSSPGYVGPYQYLCWVCLSIFAIDKSLAFSFSIVLHALWYVPLTSLGFIFLWREHVSIGQIRSLEARVASDGFSSLEADEPDELRFE